MRIGGTEMVIQNLLMGQSDPNVNQQVLCLEKTLGRFGELLIREGVKIHNLNWQGGFDKQLIRQIRHFLRENDIDIIHCHQYTPWVYGCLAAVFLKTKVIFTEHGRFYPDRRSWKRRFINPLLAKNTDGITAISAATKQALVEFEYLKARDIKVIYNGISPISSDKNKVKQLKEQYKLGLDRLVVGTIARLDPIKNQKMMIRAFSRVLVEYKNVVLMIVGGGEEEESLKALVQELKIQDHVHFTGYIDNPVDHLQLMDLFLLSSLSEGTSMTLLESLCLGKPCVVTNAGGNAEIIVDGENGRVVENDNEILFADAIKELLTQPVERDKISENNVARFQAQFSNKTMCDKFLDLYKDVIKSNGK